MDFEKAPYPDHPSRCSSVNSQGQCPNLGYKLEDGTRVANCKAHGGARQAQSKRKQSLRNYQLDKWNAKLAAKADADGIKSLRDEIGILRIVLEERLNKCNDAMDLILQSGPISDLVMKINTVVQSCHKLEKNMGHLLDKQAILQFAQVVVGIVSNVLEDQPEEINKIADQILGAVGEMGSV